MITLSFDITAPNYLQIIDEFITESKINPKDLLKVNVILQHNQPYDEFQLTVANQQSVIKLVSTYDGIEPTLVTSEDIEVHLVK